VAKVLIFDFDGTIANSEDAIVEIYNNLAERSGNPIIDKGDMINLRGKSIIGKCKALKISIRRLPFLFKKLKQQYRAKLKAIPLKNGIQELLHQLCSMGFTLDIISSNQEKVIREFLKQNDIEVFDNVYSTKSLFSKHHTIKKFIKKRNIDNTDVIYIGDEVRDITSCKIAGIKIIAVTWGYDSREILSQAQPDFMADTPSQIIEAAQSIFSTMTKR